MLPIIMATRGFLAVAPYHRIEAAVDVEFVPGQRFVEALGFQQEARMQQFCCDKRDHYLYVRMKSWQQPQ